MPRGYPGIVVLPAEARRRWREKNPEKVKAANHRPRIRNYDSQKTKAWRTKRLADPFYRARINKQANDRATMIRRWLDAYKLSKGCVDCGYKEHHAALHFDHVSGEKEINVCNAKSIDQAKKEIEKCEVRCANCHAVRTFVLYPCKPDIFDATYERVGETMK